MTIYYAFHGRANYLQLECICGKKINQNNILVANEVFHYLKLKKRGREYGKAMKVDTNNHMIELGGVSWLLLWRKWALMANG